MSGMKRLARLLETVLIVVCVLLLAYLVCLSQGRGWHWRDGEAKHGLLEIQIAVEHFAVDHDGAYPLYLSGGEARWSAQVNVNKPTKPFTGTVECSDKSMLTDPLLREGYLTAYPRNPFAKNGVGVHQAQLTLPINSPEGDPLRNGALAGQVYGTRFGADCTRMGQVLGVKYYYIAATTIAQGATSNPSNLNINRATLCSTPLSDLPPGADTTYRYWGIWTDKHARNPLPGQFIYSALGPVAYLPNGQSEKQSRAPQQPASGFVEMDQFVLAVFGGPKTKGRDRLDAAGSPWCLQSGSSFDVVPFTGDGIADGILIMRTLESDLPD